VIITSDKINNALLSLQLLWLSGSRPLTASYLSEKVGMSHKSIQTLMEQFKKGGIVEKKLNSEYVLSLGPERFTVYDLGHLLEEEFFTSGQSINNLLLFSQHKDIIGLGNLKHLLLKYLKNIELEELLESCCVNDNNKIIPFTLGEV
jgi:biotin operon repressor